MCFDDNIVQSSQSSQCDSCGTPSENEYEDFILCELCAEKWPFIPGSNCVSRAGGIRTEPSAEPTWEAPEDNMPCRVCVLTLTLALTPTDEGLLRLSPIVVARKQFGPERDGAFMLRAAFNSDIARRRTRILLRDTSGNDVSATAALDTCSNRTLVSPAFALAKISGIAVEELVGQQFLILAAPFALLALMGHISC